MNNKPRRLTGLALKLAAVAAAALPVFAVAPGAAAAQQEPAAAAGVLDCTTDTDGYWGHAHCTNTTGGETSFRVHVVCGVWPDAYGDWKTPAPGAADTSSARCFGGTGVGDVLVEEK
ncbi:hypothetical protein [Streptomyces sp. MZ04]|uniref:hypothetical protein n=1 Tax=Streptomyces sp. MZ04 TaxID=2559236 RepID=UPI00107E8157|nr:hypothetical protein [Streptomyces sp. MZ04]TGB00095.1 hypothetical protein E2651_29000 [Streptomyces sp. MZ04]